MPLTPDSRGPGSPYDYQSPGWWTTSTVEQYPDAWEVPQMHGVESDASIYEFPYSFVSAQLPVSASLPSWMFKEAPIEHPQQNDRRQRRPDSPFSSDSWGLTTVEVHLRQKERRRAQNRVAQRAYRFRKEEKIKELLAKMSEMKREMEGMEQLNQDLSAQISTLLQKIPTVGKENRILKAG